MIVRKATSTDVSLLARLNQQLIVDEGHRNPMTLAELEQRMAGWIGDEGYEAVLLEPDRKTVGYALFRREPEHIYLRQFFVCRDFRRQGFGRQAIDWLLRHAWNDALRVRLDVWIGNEEAISFWRAVGFRDYCLTMERNEIP